MAILLVPLVAMVAFTVDIGRITMTTAECQNAADAAVLAGANELEKGFAYYIFYADSSSLSGYEDNAIASAQTVCAMHKNTDIASIALLSGDIEFGYTDGNYNYYPGSYGSLISVSGSSYYPNTITVVVRRDSTPGGNPPLTMLFGAALGTATAPATVNARAVLRTADLSGPPSNMLPLALDYNSWNAFIYNETKDRGSKWLSNPFGLNDPQLGGVGLSGKTFGGYNNYPFTATPYTTPTSGAIGGFTGKDQLQVYPIPDAVPGNFGWLSMNNNDNSADSLKNWITNGLSTQDQSALTTQQTVGGSGDVLFPVKSTDLAPGSVLNAGVNIHDRTMGDWKSIPGFKDSDVQALYEMYGQTGYGGTAFLPLFAPANGTLGANNYVSGLKNPGIYDGTNGGDGQNSYLNIVDYVGVTITIIEPTGGARSAQINVQPSLVTPKGANLINVRPAGSGASSYIQIVPQLVAVPPS
jgi:hypothetical protein